jgi:GntR family transcriptional regulator
MAATTAQVEILRAASRLQPRAAASGELRMPIYVQLVTLFHRRIKSGEWPVGQQVPTLDDLTAEFGVARATIRYAIGFLEREGLIGRYRGRGTFVLKKPDIEIWHEIPTTWSQLVNVEPDIKHEWIDCRRADTPPVPSHPGGRLAAEYQLLHRLHRRDGVPYLIGRSYVELNLFKAIGKKGFDNAAPYRTLHRHLGKAIARAEQSIVVGTASVEEAHLLDIALNAPIVIAFRSVFDTKGVLIHEAEGVHRGDFVRVRMQLK